MTWIKKENYWISLTNARQAFEHKETGRRKTQPDTVMSIIWSAPSLTVKNRDIHMKIRIKDLKTHYLYLIPF